ncbi:hypothetical protein CROQUDRAFT_101224 [Cronartium quercuum f. sp. fusiforme G11]|uniref:Uncharacterized protein n=1 Tax=Cronartium quercuum f. sp. fusiforme G11 TaxID=708437 RepID=A0A9P6N8K4_9BASI|nr:hypothetical protein CROQUDRAFT_101224 [Cronartium quercuum f. sp. fusiforme G11]
MADSQSLDVFLSQSFAQTTLPAPGQAFRIVFEFHCSTSSGYSGFGLAQAFSRVSLANQISIQSHSANTKFRRTPKNHTDSTCDPDSWWTAQYFDPPKHVSQYAPHIKIRWRFHRTTSRSDRESMSKKGKDAAFMSPQSKYTCIESAVGLNAGPASPTLLTEST